MALTRITKGVIKPNENYDTHNINSTGIITAVGANFTGNVSVGGVLTYEDVSSIDAVGIITANQGIHVGTGISAVGIITAATFKGDGDFVDIDVDGHTNLDNVSIAGVTTSQTINFATNARAKFASNNRLQIHSNGTNSYLDYGGSLNVRGNSGSSAALSFGSDSNLLVTNNLNINGDLDVDGHTNLDNVNIAGVTTTTDDINLPNDKKVNFGSFGFQIYQNTSASNNAIIKQSASGQFLRLITNGGALSLEADSVNLRNSANNAQTAIFSAGGKTSLYYNSNLKFTTENTGVNIIGIVTATSADINGDLDVDGHTNLDNVSIAGVTTMGQTIIAHTSSPQLIIKDSDTTGAADSNGISFQDASSTQYGFIGQTSSGGHTMLINTTNTVNPIRLQVNSSTKLEVGNTGVYVQNGNFYVLGSGSSNISGDVNLNSNAPTVNFNDTNGNPDYQVFVNTGVFKITDTTNNVDRITIATNGNISITNDLDVDGHTNLDNVSIAGVSTNTSTTYFDNQVYWRNSGSNKMFTLSNNAGMNWQDSVKAEFGNSGDLKIYHESGVNYIYGTGTNAPTVFMTSATERLRIDSNGYVGIKESSPHLYYSPDLVVKAAAENGGITIRSAGTTHNNYLMFADGNSGDSRYDGYIKYNHNSRQFDFATAATTRLSIDSNGRVVIGHTQASTNYGKLIHIHNSASAGASVHLTDSTTGTSNSDGFELVMHNQSAYLVQRENNSMIFMTNGTNERLRITQSGEVNIGGNYTQTTVPFCVTTNANDYGIRLQTGSNVVCEILNNDSAGNSEIRGYYNNNSGTRGEGYRLEANGETFFNPGGTSGLSITTGGIVKIGGSIGNNADIDASNTKLIIKQSANNKEDGIYLERSGERRGFYMYVGGAGSYSDALCITTNQLGTDTDILAIDRGNRLAKLGGSVIIDSSNNGYGGLRIYDDSSGDYNVRYIAGRNQGATAHVFMRSGRTQGTTPWTDATPAEMVRLTSGRGISFNGDTDSSLGYHTADHMKIKTGDKDVAHFDNRKVLTAPKLNTKALVFSSCTNKWASQRSVLKFYMEFYTGASSATYHFMRMISQPDWSFDDVTIKQIRYQYQPDSGDHATRRYYTYYGNHYEDVINYNQRGGVSSGNSSNYITKRTDFGPGGAFKIHEAANGGYYRDLWGSDYSIGLSNYLGVKLEITVYNTVGVYDTGTYATASDFYPAAFGGQATQSAADSHGGPRGVWFNTTSNGTGSGTAPVVAMHSNSAYGWSTGSNFFDTSL